MKEKKFEHCTFTPYTILYFALGQVTHKYKYNTRQGTSLDSSLCNKEVNWILSRDINFFFVTADKL